MGQVLPLALITTISPIPIVAVIALLFTPRPRASGVAYFCGLLVGVGLVLGVLTWFASPEGAAGGLDSSPAKAIVELLVGIGLLVAAVRRWSKRPPPGVVPDPPRWMEGISKFTPARSGGLGLLVGMGNPKSIAAALVAAVTLAASDASGTQTITIVAAYSALAAAGVLVPVVAVLVQGERVEPRLRRWKVWLGHNDAVVLAVILAVLGVLLVVDGILGM